MCVFLCVCVCVCACVCVCVRARAQVPALHSRHHHTPRTRRRNMAKVSTSRCPAIAYQAITNHTIQRVRHIRMPHVVVMSVRVVLFVPCRLNQKFNMYRERVAAVVSEVFQKKLMEAMDTIKKATGVCVCVCVCASVRYMHVGVLIDMWTRQGRKPHL